jgi:hypothetical protein
MRGKTEIEGEGSMPLPESTANYHCANPVTGALQ